MIKIRPSVFQRNIRALLKKALTEPIYVLRKKGKEDLVLISSEHYQVLLQYQRKSLLTTELSAQDIELISQLSMSEKHNHLNAECIKK